MATPQARAAKGTMKPAPRAPRAAGSSSNNHAQDIAKWSQRLSSQDVKSRETDEQKQKLVKDILETLRGELNAIEEDDWMFEKKVAVL